MCKVVVSSRMGGGTRGEVTEIRDTRGRNGAFFFFFSLWVSVS